MGAVGKKMKIETKKVEIELYNLFKQNIYLRKVKK